MSYRVSHHIWKSAASLAIVTALAAGCAPQGAQKVKEEVVEIEEIEMAPAEPAKQPDADGDAARKAMDEEKAAADKAIDEAAKSSEQPKKEATAEPPMKE